MMDRPSTGRKSLEIERANIARKQSCEQLSSSGFDVTAEGNGDSGLFPIAND